MKLVKEIFKEKVISCLYIVFPIIFIAAYLSHFFLFGKDTYILIHDNLDSNLVWTKLLCESGKIFAPSNETLANIMNGTPRLSFGTEFNLFVLLFSFLKPFEAYVTGICITHICAFLGMYLLLKKHFLKDKNERYIASGVALCFALLPFWPFGGLSVAGQPLALYSFLNFRSKKYAWHDWLILALIPFYSSFILSFFFFLLLVFSVWLYDLIKKKNFNFVFLSAIIFMTFIFIFVEYRLFYSVFINSVFQSHRSEFTSFFTDSFKRGLDIFLNNGQYHAYSLQRRSIHWSLFLSVLIFLFLKLSKDLKDKEIIKAFDNRIWLYLSLIICSCVFYSLWYWEPFSRNIKAITFLSSAVDFSRFHFLCPLLWHLIFALTLVFLFKYLSERFGHLKSKIFILFLISIQVFYCFHKSDFVTQRKKINVTYRQFFAEKLFTEIKNYINKNQEEYKVISIGIHPAIAEYNGFYTVDGFLVNYPVEYKYKFRKIIEKELEKDKDLKGYFDNWGSRFYVFSSELGAEFDDKASRNKITSVKNLELNYNAMKELKVNYVLSRVPIENFSENNLLFLKKFSKPNSESAWEIYLYEIR